MKKIVVLILLLFINNLVAMQAKGSLKGTVIDLETKQPANRG